MDSIQTVSDTNSHGNSLSEFCREVMSRHADKWPPSESVLADEFVERYSAELLITLERIAQFSETLGIETIEASLPERISGFNFSLEEKKLVVLQAKESFPGSREHTFFHELREILEYTFSDLGFHTVEASELEEHAEEFATYVRIAGTMKFWCMFFKDAENIQVRWKRWLAYGGIIGVSMICGLGCALFPYIEDQLSRHKLES